MEKSTRNILILVGAVALGLTAYYLYDKNRRKKTVSIGVTADSKQNKITFTRG
jgi:hypothetical protein